MIRVYWNSTARRGSNRETRRNAAMDAKMVKTACGLMLAAGLGLPAIAQDDPAGSSGPVVEARPETPGRRSSLVQRAYVTRFMPALPLGNPNGPGVDDPATF